MFNRYYSSSGPSGPNATTYLPDGKIIRNNDIVAEATKRINESGKDTVEFDVENYYHVVANKSDRSISITRCSQKK